MLSGVSDRPAADQPISAVNADVALIAENRHRDLAGLALMAF
jgi:hypothetical protein